MKIHSYILLALAVILALGLSACTTPSIPECKVGGFMGMGGTTYHEGDQHPDNAGYFCGTDGKFHPKSSTEPAAGETPTPTLPPTAGETETQTPTVTPTPTPTSVNEAAVEVHQFLDWPHQNGANKTETIQAPNDAYVLVQYGFEARVNGKEVAGCGVALVSPGATVTIIVWDGNAETLKGSATAIKAYAESELKARKENEDRCDHWETIGVDNTAE